MNWYYAEAGRQKGPVDDTSLDQLVTQGVVRDDTLVWNEGMSGWQPHASVRGTRAAPPPFAPTTAAYAAPASVVPAAPHYGGFWIRFVARFIDGIILGATSAIIRLPLVAIFGLGSFAGLRNGNPEDVIAALPGIMGFFGLSFFIGIAIGLAYEVFFLSTRGATPGKMVFGLKVIRADGGPITPALAAGRYFAVWLSYLTLMIGFIIAGFDSQKRALEDHICETRVIYSR
ncbi:MAG TPA: RDD family protein [Bryobacteraceae bacterium]